MDNHTPKLPTLEELEWIERSWTIIPATGLIYSPFAKRYIGSISVEGYVTVMIHATKRVVKRSHLVWWKFHGTWPLQMLDHKDRDKVNDCITNLRYATSRINAENHGRIRDLPTGVAHHHSKTYPYKAQIWKNGKTHKLGHYKSPDEAHARYLEERELLEASNGN